MANIQQSNFKSEFKGRRNSNDIIHFRFLIPCKAASVIIGKGCERIQRLMQECNARMSIPDSKGPERVLTVESSMDDCIKIWSDCLPDLKDVMGANCHRASSDIDMRFLCHSSIVGAIIGRAGSRVKELKTTYQLSIIKVHQEMAPKSTDRVIQLVGPSEKIFECLGIIFTELESQSIRGPIDNYNTNNFNEQLPQTYGGWTHQFGKAEEELGLTSFEPAPLNKPLGGYDAGRMTENSMKRQTAGQYNDERLGSHPNDQYGGIRNNAPQMDPYIGFRKSKQMDPYSEDGDNYVDPQIDQFGVPRYPAGQYGPARNVAPQMDQYGIAKIAGYPVDQYGCARDSTTRMDQYGGERNVSPEMDQYGGARNMVDQYGGPRNMPHQMDQYGASRNMPSQGDQYGGVRNTSPHMDQYGSAGNMAPQIDQYGGSRAMPPQLDQYGALRSMQPQDDPYGGVRNMTPQMDQYGGPRGMPPQMDQYGGPRNNDQYGGRTNATPITNQYVGDRKSGSIGDPYGGRKVVPLMAQFPSGGEFEYEDDFFETLPSKFSVGGVDSKNTRRRPYGDEKYGANSKKQRMWNNEGGATSGYKSSDSVSNTSSTKDSVDISVPYTCLPTLQGSGGEKLYNIMKDSGAEIVVRPEEGKTDDRVLTLRGTKDQIEGAQYLMQMCMKRCILNL